jgi:chromosome segregation ATPase
MAQCRSSASVSTDENDLSFRWPSGTDRGAAALELVQQAADVFRGMERRARETEARAQSLCNSAIEKVRRAETRAEAAERAHRSLVIEAEDKLRQASSALEEARSRLADKEDQLTAMEFRAQAAEAEAREVKQALALVEEAIRRRLLCTSAKTEAGLAAVA